MLIVNFPVCIALPLIMFSVGFVLLTRFSRHSPRLSLVPWGVEKEFENVNIGHSHSRVFAKVTLDIIESSIK